MCLLLVHKTSVQCKQSYGSIILDKQSSRFDLYSLISSEFAFFHEVQTLCKFDVNMVWKYFI